MVESIEKYLGLTSNCGLTLEEEDTFIAVLYLQHVLRADIIINETSLCNYAAALGKIDAKLNSDNKKVG